MWIMTFPEKLSMSGNDQQQPMNISSAIEKTLVQAKSEDRLVSGIYSSVKNLQLNPELVMLCLLMEADPSEDVSIHIQHTLIEAYCLEQDIHFLKVSNLDSMGHVLGLPTTDTRNSKTDFGCILVQFPKIRSDVDDFIIDYCDKMVLADDVFSRPMIDLPV